MAGLFSISSPPWMIGGLLGVFIVTIAPAALALDRRVWLRQGEIDEGPSHDRPTILPLAPTAGGSRRSRHRT
jgi:hypothetical protein